MFKKIINSIDHNCQKSGNTKEWPAAKVKIR